MGNFHPKSRGGTELAARRTRVLELRVQGNSYPKIAERIAEEFGRPYVRQQAYQDLELALKELARRNEQNAILYQALLLERLEAMWEAVADKALAGDSKAFDQALRVIDRQARVSGAETVTVVQQESPVTLQGYLEYLAEKQNLKSANPDESAIAVESEEL